MLETLQNLQKYIGMELPTEKKELRNLKKEIRKEKKTFLDDFRAKVKELKELKNDKKSIVPQVTVIQVKIRELTKRQPKEVLSPITTQDVWTETQ